MNFKRNTFTTKIGLSLLVCISLFSIRCAKVGTITGGPKDTRPPVLVSSDPEMFATQFDDNKIKLEFDEFIQLKDVSKQVNVSPPFKKKPKIWVNSKSVIVQYTDTLRDSTTYTFNFGSAIVDNNEGNPLENFEFVFSTGAFIDSMGVRGRILDALLGLPCKQPFVAMLYENLADSAPIKEKPIFTSRANKNGYFAINNVRPGKYRLYALLDDNSNLKYDVGSESFAFADTVLILDPAIVATMIKPERIDTSQKDSTKQNVEPDMLELKRRRNSVIVDLFSFDEKSKQQINKTYEWRNKRFLLLTFANKLKDDSLVLNPIYGNYNNWYKKEYLGDHDSILVWLTDTNLLKTDTLRASISYWGNAKNGDTAWITDTLNFRYVTEETETKNDKKDKKQQFENEIFMKIVTTESGTINLDANVLFETEFPASFPDTSFIKFVKMVDTIGHKEKYKLIQDTVGFRRFLLNAKWEENTTYELTFLPGAFKNIYSIPHDTTKFAFTTRKADYYGKLTVLLENVTKPVILQLLDKEKVIYEQFVVKNSPVVFEYIEPKEYTLRAILDENGDKKWTTGDFLLKRQAEKAIYFNEIKNIRANWDVEMSWELNFE